MYSQTILSTDVAVQAIPEITVYRGDSREPKEIFSTGFKARRPSAPHYNEFNLPNPQSCICFSKSMDPATLFPLQRLKKVRDTWVYVFRIPLTEDYDDFNEKLYQRAVEDEDNWDKHLQLTFSEEGNVKEVKPSQIIGAFRCKRVLFGEDHNFDGGAFRLTEYVPNPSFNKLDESLQKTIEENKNKIDQWHPMPTFLNRFPLLRSEVINNIRFKHILASKAHRFVSKFDTFMQRFEQNKKKEEIEIEKLTARKSSLLIEEKGGGERVEMSTAVSNAIVTTTIDTKFDKDNLKNPITNSSASFYKKVDVVSFKSTPDPKQSARCPLFDCCRPRALR